MQEQTTAAEMERRWQHCLDELSFEMSRVTFATWLQDSRLLAADGDSPTVGIVHGAGGGWMEQRLVPTLRATLDRHLPGLAAVHARPLSAEAEAEARAGGDGQGARHGQVPAAAHVEADEQIEVETLEVVSTRRDQPLGARAPRTTASLTPP
jgi:hypothetical protein